MHLHPSATSWFPSLAILCLPSPSTTWPWCYEISPGQTREGPGTPWPWYSTLPRDSQVGTAAAVSSALTGTATPFSLHWALALPPSAGQGLAFSAQHHLSPSLLQLAHYPWRPHRWQSQVNNLCGTSWVLPYPLSSPSSHRNTGTTCTQASFFLTHGETRAQPLVSFEIGRKMSVQEHDSWTGLLGPVQCLIANLGFFASILFYFLRKTKQNKTALIYLVS